MRWLSVLRGLLPFGLLALAVAQEATPRFVLPATPFDYGPIAAAGLGAKFSLPVRNGGPAPRGCGPVDASLPPPPPDRTDQLATLGRVLFYETCLSRNRSRSCASCHEQARAFADGAARSRGFEGRPTRRNSMSIANLGLLTRDGGAAGFFWDARAATLEQMVLMPIRDPIEMGMDVPGVIARLQREPGYAALFEQAFGDPAIDEPRLAAALAQFVRSIVSLRSRYDEGLAATGRTDVPFPGFTAAENRGKALFFGTAAGWSSQSCASCHVASVVSCCGPVMDPLHFASETCSNNGVDHGKAGDDPGLGAVTGQSGDRGKFRAPSLRNVEVTAPYMHDGRFATLEQVVQFYAGRVHDHPNLDPRMRPDARASKPVAATMVATASASVPIGMPLNTRERADLIAFLKTLTDRELLRDPRFADPFVR